MALTEYVSQHHCIHLDLSVDEMAEAIKHDIFTYGGDTTCNLILEYGDRLLDEIKLILIDRVSGSGGTS